MLHVPLTKKSLNSFSLMKQHVVMSGDVFWKLSFTMQVNKTQEEINQEIANKIALNKQLQTAETHTSRTSLNATITNSNNKIESLMLLQLQYCAGLQHCLDQEEEQRQQAQANAVADLAVLQNISMSPQAKESITFLTPAECKDDIPAEDGQEAVDFEEQTASAVAQVLNKVIHFDDDSSLSDENNEDEEDTWRWNEVTHPVKWYCFQNGRFAQCLSAIKSGKTF